MHFFEFLQLEEMEQLETLWYNGEQIGKRKETNYLILLYQVEGFYVEVFYHTREKTIKKYLSFEDLEKLDPYLDSIDLSPVYKLISKIPKGSEHSFVVSTALIKKQHDQIPKTPNKKESSKPGFWDKLKSIFSK